MSAEAEQPQQPQAEDSAAAAAAPMEDEAVAAAASNEATTAAASGQAAAAAPAAAGSLADLDDGEDELAAEQAAARAAAADSAMADEQGDVDDEAAGDTGAAAASAAAAAEDVEGGGEEAEAGDAGDESAAAAPADDEQDEAALESLIAEHCRSILASMSTAEVMQSTKSHVLDRLKDVLGKKFVKKNKPLCTRLARAAAQARLAEVEGEGEAAAEEPAAAAGVGEEEVEDEEEEAPRSSKKGKKRLRKKADDDDDDEDAPGGGDDDDYEDRPAKKKKSSSSRKKGSSASAAAAAAPASSTVALLAFETPKSAYQLFQSSVRRALKDDHPDASPHELAKLIADKWASLDPDEKGDYEARAQRARNQHREDLERLKREDPEAYASHQRAVKKREEEAITGGGKKKKKRSGDEYDDDPSDGHDPDASPPPELSYFDSIVQSLKHKKNSKSQLTDEEQKDLEAAFMERMRNAARADEAAAKEGKPAVHRLKMLPDVQQQLAKRQVADRMLEDGLLACICLWLQPEADGSLPNVRLRTVLYKILDALNVNETFLANSHGLGRRIMRLWKSEEETLANKRVLSALMEKWMRPMLGLSMDFRKMQEVEEERAGEIFRRKAVIDAAPAQRNYNPKRARLPEPARFDYAIRPQAQMDHEAEAEEAMEAGKKAPAESRKQQLHKRLDKMNKGGGSVAKPRFKVDITGRSLTL